MSEPISTTIEYMCNLCQKIRLTIIPKVLQPKINSAGYVEIIDVHNCKDDQMKASILFIDTSYTVRSQVLVDPIGTKKEKKKQAFDLGIPSPKATALPTQTINPIRDLDQPYLTKMKINDNLRQHIYKYEVLKEGKNLSWKSPLGFIKIKATFSTTISNNIVQMWLDKVAKILESITMFDEGMLSYLCDYLTDRIHKKPSKQEEMELEVLLNSSYTFPKTTVAQNEILNLGDDWINLIKKLSKEEMNIYSFIVKTSSNNVKMTTLGLYIEILEKISMSITFSQFMSAMASLLLNKYISLEKISFITIKE